MTPLKQAIPAAVLVFIAPIIAEVLLGDFAVEQIRVLAFIGPMYGFGALLIREFTRRTGRGWPTMIALAFVYGAIEEGVGDQSLFNPNFMNAHLLEYGFIPALGMGAVLTVFILNLHVIWSICTPIGLVELLFASQRTEPWLGRYGLYATGPLYLISTGVVTRQFLRTFSATPFQYGIVAGLVAIGLFVAILVFRPDKRALPLPGTAPSALILGVLAFACTTFGALLFRRQWHVPAAATVLALLAMDVVACAYIFTSARRKGWSNSHRFALVAGALLTYCWWGFFAIRKNAPDTIPSHTALVAAFLALLLLMGLRLRTASMSSQNADAGAPVHSTKDDRTKLRSLLPSASEP